MKKLNKTTLKDGITKLGNVATCIFVFGICAVAGCSKDKQGA